MKLHLPVRLFKSVLACLAAVASFSLSSGVAWAEVQNLIFNGTTLTWDTSEDNKPFVDEEDAAASFAAGDNVSFTSESTVTLGEDISAGTVAIEKDADVTIDLGEFELDVARIELSGTLDMGDSLSIGKGDALAMTGAGAVLDSNLVLGEKGLLSVTGAGGSLNGHSLTLQEGASLILTGAVLSRETIDANGDGELSLIVIPTGDGKTYTLLTGISTLLDKNGDTLAAGSYSVNDYFDKTAPGSGFWADATLVYTADGMLQIVRHGETVKAAETITTCQNGDAITYQYYAGIAFKDIIGSSSGGAINGGTITLSNNGSVTFSGNTASSGSSAAEGGAIYGGYGSTITLSNNGSVYFSGNMASGSDDAHGGAIDGGYGSTITLSNNGSVYFSGNMASGSDDAYGGAIDGRSNSSITLSNNGSVAFSGNTASGSRYSEGGAIIGSSITLSNNGSVTFSGNTASGSDDALGGAINGGTITLSNNGSVTFSGNTASSGLDDAEGGAINGGTITLSNNGSVTFSGNTASGSFVHGGAIDGSLGSPLKINNNGETIFRGNYAHSTASRAYGGAIHKQRGIFSIQNNASVVFEKNYALGTETLRLQSIYAYDLEDAGKEMLVNFSAPKGGKIEFRDSIDIEVARNSASAFHLNNWYINDDEEKVAQTGDIIFTGEDATAENLKAILAEHGIHREATADEIRLSKTSEVSGTMQLHDGRLIVRDGAIIYADGITVHGSASGESTPTLWLDNGELNYSNFSTSKNAVTISGGSALRLSGQNTARNSTLTLSAGSTFIIDVAAAHTTTAALTLNSSTLSLGGTITLQLNAAEGLNTAGRYMLLSGVSAPTDWVSNITVSGGVWTIDDLSWVNNILYLNFPTLTEATWNNQSGDRLWNVNSSVNWEQHDIDYAYKDGIGVIFGDEGAGKVTLVGTLTPASVLVNSTGNYSFEGSGSLSGGMTLTKQGSGTLSISTANSYTGGTMIEAGTVVAKHAAALGMGMVTLAGGTLEIAVTGVGNNIANTGTSTLKVANGRTHGLTGTIANSGELTLIGNFDASKLDKSELADVYVDVLGNETVDGSGFTRSGDFTVSIANGTVDSTGASVSYKGTTLEMTGGVGLSKGGMLWSEYRILNGHEVELSAIVNKAAENQVSSTNIRLNGGKLTADRALTGTLSISGTSTLHGVDFNLGNAPLQNSGDLTLTGSFDASGLSKSKTWNSYVTTSNEASTAGSGFLREGDFEVTVVTGTGTVVSSGVTTMKYGEQNLTMDGAIGSGVGAMQYDTYRILSGHEVELSAIVNKAAENQVSTTDIQLNGGKLMANRALTGTLSISGTSTLHGVEFNLGNAPLQNSGDLTLTGSFDASGLSKSKTWNSYVTTSNEVSTDGSGFLREGDFEVTVVTGTGTVDSSGVTAMKYGSQNLTMDGAIGSGVGEMQYDSYRILSGHTASSSAIHGYDEGKGMNALITLADGGTLNADDAATETKVSATGGSINLSAGTLSGTVGGSTAVAVSGTATMSGENSYTGGTTLNGAALTVTHANALGTGVINTTGESSLTSAGVEALVLHSVISNRGELTLIGNYDASKLDKSDSTDVYVDVLGNETVDGSGFTRSGDFTVSIANGTVDSTGASVSYKGTTLEMTGGVGLSKGGMLWSEYRILNGHEVELSAIVDKAAENQVSTTDIQLNGGKLTANRALTGTLSISGTSTLHGVDFNLGNAPLQNNGDLTLTGSFDASGLSKSKTWNSYVTTSNEVSTDGSGFQREGDFEVTVVTGTGTVDSSGVTAMKYGSQNLTMDGAIGSGVGEMQYDTYRILSGHTASSSAIHGYDEGKGKNALITLADGGSLNADDETTETKVNAMGGSINLSAGTLSGTVGGSTIVTVSGTATMSGDNSYTGGTEIDNSRLTITHANALGTGGIETRGNSSLEVNGVTLVLGSTINHSATGTLSLSGKIDASALEKSDSDDVFVDVYGDETKNGSGFVRSGDFTVTVVDEGTVDSSAATITWNGTSLTMNNGVGSAKGGMLYGTYRILTGHTASSTAIHGYDNGAGANAVVTLVAGGTLNADDANGVNVTATGGTINLSAGALSGTWANVSVTATGGSLAGSFDGISTLAGTGFVLGNTAVQNNGTLTLRGSFDASGLVSTATGKDMFVDTSNNVTENGSGFRRTEDFTVLVATGTVDSSNAVVTYGGQTLTMTDGTGFGVGSIQYDTYLLKGNDTATVSTIATKAGAALQKIDMQGGTLNVNASTDKLVATGGSIVLSAGTLGGSIGGTAAVTVSGTASISGNNSYTGGTVIDGGSLTITHANALGTGGIETKGNSSLVVNGVTLKLQGVIDNTAGGELTLSGSLDASGLTLSRTEEGRLGLDGTKVSLAESGFARGVEYSVQIVEGGTTVNDGASISHKDYLSRTQLVLGEDGYARAGGAVDYTHFFLTGGDSAVVSEIADVSAQHQETLAGVTMDSGSLEVDQSIAVNATGGSIHITDDAVLSGTVEDTAVSTAADDYSSEIAALLKGDTTLEVNGGAVTVSGDNSYSGGTVVNGGALFAGHDNAFGAGDVTVNDATLDLNRFTVANKVLMNGNSTLGHADGASHIVLGGGSKVNFRDGYTLSAGKVLEVASPGASYTGALTLGGGTLELDGKLTVQGDVTFESGTQTTLDISGWNGADDGDVLATLGSSNSGYAEESLKLAGIAGDWELDFDAATGVLTLVAVKDEPLPEPEFNPNLNRNQQVVYDTIKDIMGEGNPGGLLGELGKEVTGTRDEEKLKQLLDELGGAEYATLLSGQQAAARGHMRRLRGEMGSGHLLADTAIRAYIEAYNHRSEVDGDAHGRGYELNESGGQFALEFLGEDSVSGGFAVAAGRSKLQPDGGMTQKSDNTYMDAFVMYRDGAYTGKFSLGVGVHKYDLDRRVAGNAVSADTSGSSVNFMHESAWAMSLSESHSVQVFGAVESSFNRLGAFHEKGADTASLQVESQDAWVTTLSLGARYLYSFAALESAPAATLSLQGGLELDFGDTDSEVEMNFEGARSHRFRQSGAERDTFGYNLGASLHLPVSAKAAIYASGDAVLRGDSYEVNANVGLQMAF